jgi:hypothetical protein
MALRLFKKKDGSPSGFAKILKGVAKVASVAAPLVPIPGSSKIGSFLGKIGSKIGVNLAAAAPAAGETIGSFANRVAKGAGGAMAGFVEQVETAPELNASGKPIQVKEAMKQGFVQNKYGKYILYAALGLGGFFLLKKFKVIK